MYTAALFILMEVDMADYKALYRKWRPVDFDDVCGQNRITDILKYEVATDKTSHAYLFCGSRGTGKTSCAKILAKAVNCLDNKNGNPCNRCEACRSIDSGIATDVIEMDAASNNGVDNVRNLKDEISFTPALLKYRVYIIDEVHMMSTQAFNALLKTLEEPPGYVIFILATTEYNKLPTTIVSRCQRFDFRRISSDIIVERLMKIAESEGIDLGEDGARIIARASRGGLRDAVSLLELCAGSKVHIDSAHVAQTIGTGDRESAYKLIEALGRSDYDSVYSIIREIVMNSGDISVFWQEIIDSYRDIMVVKNTDKAKAYLDLTDGEYDRVRQIAQGFSAARLSYHTSLLEEALADMQRAVNSKESIAEIALTRMCDSRLVVSLEALALRVEELEKQVSLMKLGVTVPTREAAVPKPVSSANPSEKKEAAQKSTVDATTTNASTEMLPYSNWGKVLERMGEIKKSLSCQFVSAKVYRKSKTSFVIYMSEFFAERIKSNASDMAIICGVIAEREGLSQSEIDVVIVSKDADKKDDISSELEKLIK